MRYERDYRLVAIGRELVATLILYRVALVIRSEMIRWSSVLHLFDVPHCRRVRDLYYAESQDVL